ncbi:MAG: HAD family hydrolase [Oscillospiraceae bacterium]|nr:HAD family hydrolase [Oscillospiraceae bacterium]
MIKIEIPGREALVLNYLAVDYNGTIAKDGKLIEGLAERFEMLKDRLEIIILTADTYGTVKKQCAELPVRVETFPRPGAAECKLEIVNSLGDGVVCLGNGFNDILMFDAADLSVAVLDAEGMCAALLPHADVLVMSPLDALDLLIKPDRLRATLRS